MDKNVTHWRQMTDCTYLRAELLKPKERKVLTIKDVKSELVQSGSGDSEHRPVLYFEENELPMVLNNTNAETITDLYSTGNPTDWIGKKIQVFATNTKAFGEVVACLRVEKTIPVTNEVTYHCAICGKTIDKKTYDGSVSKYGKPYCSKECLDKDTKGEDVL